MRWVVAGYRRDLDLLGPSPSHRAFASVTQGPDARGRFLDRIREAAGRSLSPTFTVVLPGTSGVRREPGLADHPILWPDSGDPDAIVEEILAVCRAIEAGWSDRAE